MANELFYSYGANFGGEYLGQADDQSVETNLTDLVVHQSGDYAPGFSGAKSNSPEYRLDTMDVAKVFDLVSSGNGGVDDLVRDFSAGNVDWLYRAAANRSTRVAVGTGSHYIYRMVQNAMFYWDGFRADSKGEVSVSTKTIATMTGANPATTLVPNQQLPTASDVSNLYTMGKVVVNGTTITRLQSMNWSNNVKVENELADGAASPTFAGIDEFAPTCQFDSQDLAAVGAFGFEGFPISSNFDVYLRKRKVGKINHPDSDTVHIRLRATAGTVLFNRVSGAKAVANCRCIMNRPTGGGAVFSITTGVAIPA